MGRHGPASIRKNICKLFADRAHEVHSRTVRRVRRTRVEQHCQAILDWHSIILPVSPRHWRGTPRTAAQSCFHHSRHQRRAQEIQSQPEPATLERTSQEAWREKHGHQYRKNVATLVGR